MGSRRKPVPLYRDSVEKIANSIPDPVGRLRFLRAAAPPLLGLRRNWLRPSRWPLAASSLIRFTLIVAAVLGGLICVVVMETATHAAPLTLPTQPVRLTVAKSPLPDVWLVEKRGLEEIYSNGLRIDNHYVVSHYARSYLAYPANHAGKPVARKDPAGIVFHTTESYQAPFEAGQNEKLQRIGESLLDYVRRKFAYHFLIDRFGRVYRVVAEGDAADHAGHSVWADEQWLYLSLNASFLGVSFEASTKPGQTESGASPAQVRSAAVLTEMLRSRYHIAAANCVTHAQVSVNPSNMQAGYHTDWASGFPFEQVGLPNNYAQPLPAVWAFGFEAGPQFRTATGARMVEGMDFAEQALQAGARSNRTSVRTYRKRLQDAYRLRMGAVRKAAAGDNGVE